jgi:hypothetical protein
MAYSPYDQVIFDDPAYLTDPEKVKEQTSRRNTRDY